MTRPAIDVDALRAAADTLRLCEAAEATTADALGPEPPRWSSAAALEAQRTLDEISSRLMDAAPSDGVPWRFVGPAAAFVGFLALLAAGAPFLLAVLVVGTVAGVAGWRTDTVRRDRDERVRQVEIARRNAAVALSRADADDAEHRAWVERAAAAALASERLASARSDWAALAGEDAAPSDAGALVAAAERRRDAEALVARARAALVEGTEQLVDLRAEWADLVRALGAAPEGEREALLDDLRRRVTASRTAADRDAARAREAARAALAGVLHGRKMERLLAEADAARPACSNQVRPLVVVDRGGARSRRRALLQRLQLVRVGMPVIVVTADDECAGWASDLASRSAS